MSSSLCTFLEFLKKKVIEIDMLTWRKSIMVFVIDCKSEENAHKFERENTILEKVLKEKFVSLETPAVSWERLNQPFGETWWAVLKATRRVHGGVEALHFLQEEESTKKIYQKHRVKSKLQQSWSKIMMSSLSMLGRLMNSWYKKLSIQR